MSTIHNPSQFKPEDYVVVDYIDSREPENISATYKHAIGEGNQGARQACYAEIKAFYDLCERYFGYRSAPCKCEHCGSYARYFGVALHKPTNKHVAIGHICTDNRLGLTNDNFRWTQLRDRAAAIATGHRRDAILVELQKTDAELHDAILSAVLDKANWADTVARELQTFNVQNSAQETVVRDVIFEGVSLLERIAVGLRKYDYKATDKQRAVLLAGLTKSREFARRKLGWTQEKEAAQAALADQPVLEGRITFTGTILSFKQVVNDYGSTLKFILRDAEGRKVYCSVPSGLEVYTDTSGNTSQEDIAATALKYGRKTVGDVVSIVVSVEQSKDVGFYWGKRPTLTPADKKALKAKEAEQG